MGWKRVAKIPAGYISAPVQGEAAAFGGTLGGLFKWKWVWYVLKVDSGGEPYRLYFKSGLHRFVYNTPICTSLVAPRVGPYPGYFIAASIDGARAFEIIVCERCIRKGEVTLFHLRHRHDTIVWL